MLMETTSGNTTRRYLKYALGEIVLVVIGILLALQINTWKTNSNNQKQEIVVLNELKGEYLGKLKELEEKVALRDAMIKGCHSILKAIDTKQYNLEQDSLYYHLGIITITPTYDASNSVTEELINSGNLYLIKNKELRKQLLDWPSTLAKMVEEEQFFIQIGMGSFFPYFIQNIPLRNLVNPFLTENDAMRKNLVKTNTVNVYKPVTSQHALDPTALFSSLVFENTVEFIRNQAVVSNMQAQDVRAHINGVLTLIENDLTKAQ